MLNGGGNYADKLVPKQAAAILGVSVQALLRWRQKRIGPCWYQYESGRVYYRRADLETWHESRRIEFNIKKGAL